MDSIPTDTIPSDPQGFVDWFKGVGIARWFAPADVRNVLQGTGIDISGGSFTSPPTIAVSANVQSLFEQPYVLIGSTIGAANLTDFRSLAVQGGVLSLTDAGAKLAATIAVVTNGIGNTQLRQGVPFSVIGNPASSTGNVQDLSQTQLTALVNLATASLSGAMPVLSGNAAQFLNGVGAFSLPSSITSANPTASVGLAAVNGSAATFMRSDAAPPLSQAISPTMTGNWIFSAASGTPIVLNPPAGSSGFSLNSTSTTNRAAFALLQGGTAFARVGIDGTNTILSDSANGDLCLSAISGAIRLGAGASVGTTAVLIQSTGVTVNAPSSGASLSIAGVSNTSTVLISSNATSAQNVTDLNIQRANGSTINTLGAGCGLGLQDTANSNATRLQNSGGQTELWQANSSVFSQIWKITTTGGFVHNGPVGFNGNSPPAQVTGWGTPTGASVQINFAGGAASLATLGAAVAKIITDLKAAGIYGA